MSRRFECPGKECNFLQGCNPIETVVLTQPTPSSSANKHYPLEIVKTFVKNSEICPNLKFAYLKKKTRDIPQCKTGVMVKNCTHCKSNCQVFHSGLNRDNYCYFYNDLFSKPIVQTFMLTGRAELLHLGSHITFGPYNNNKSEYYIHNTDYYLSKCGKVGKARAHWCKIDSNNKIDPTCQAPGGKNVWQFILNSVTIPNSSGGGEGNEGETPPPTPPPNSGPRTPSTSSTGAEPATEARLVEPVREIDFAYEQFNGVDADKEKELFTLRKDEQVVEKVVWKREDENGSTIHVLTFKYEIPNPFEKTRRRCARSLTEAFSQMTRVQEGGRKFKTICKRVEKMMVEWTNNGNNLNDLFKQVLTKENYNVLSALCRRRGQQSP